MKIVVESNQTVASRGLTIEQDGEDTNIRIQELLYKSGSQKIDRFYFCPHHPNADLSEYRVACNCRKPRPGMLLRAVQELNLDLQASYIVGDRISDIIAGHRAGCRTILVETEMHAAPPIESVDSVETTAEPDHVCADLDAAVRFILADTQ